MTRDTTALWRWLSQPAVTVVMALVGMALAVAVLIGVDPGPPPAGVPLVMQVQRIVDGDTFVGHSVDGYILTVRIADISAPERGECPGAAAATAALARLVTAEPVLVIPLYRDRYGRTVARVEVDGLDVGTALIAAGHVLPWPHDSTGRALAPRPEGCR